MPLHCHSEGPVVSLLWFSSAAPLPEPFSPSGGEKQADGRDRVVSVLPQGKNCPAASLPSRNGISDLFQLN